MDELTRLNEDRKIEKQFGEGYEEYLDSLYEIQIDREIMHQIEEQERKEKND